MYWHKDTDGAWKYYAFNGLSDVEPWAPVMNISYYEAFALAEWKGMRLPTEFEWEAASSQFSWGNLWEWTGSAYLIHDSRKRMGHWENTTVSSWLANMCYGAPHLLHQKGIRGILTVIFFIRHCDGCSLVSDWPDKELIKTRLLLMRCPST